MGSDMDMVHEHLPVRTGGIAVGQRYFTRPNGFYLGAGKRDARHDFFYDFVIMEGFFIPGDYLHGLKNTLEDTEQAIPATACPNGKKKAPAYQGRPGPFQKKRGCQSGKE
jgi:hypothetical protein